MLAKIYGILWAAVAFSAGLLFVTGNFTLLTLVVFGFVSFGMIFMGMMCVLPSTVGHHSVPAEPKTKVKKVKEEKIFHSSPLAAHKL
jgi:hypothetical protein